MLGHRAQPDLAVVAADPVLGPEVARGVDQRLAAVMRRHDRGKARTTARTSAAGGRWVQVGENGFHSRSTTGGSRPGALRDVGDHPRGLLLGRGAEIVEMVGAGTSPRRRRRRGSGKAGVEPVAALGRLDEGEVGAGGAGAAPVDRALEARDVDAVDRIVRGGAAGPVDRVAVAEPVRHASGSGVIERVRTGRLAQPAGSARPTIMGTPALHRGNRAGRDERGDGGGVELGRPAGHEVGDEPAGGRRGLEAVAALARAPDEGGVGRVGPEHQRAGRARRCAGRPSSRACRVTGSVMCAS